MECQAKGGECDETKSRSVCGTDNQTYPTRCHLIRAQCSGHKVNLKHRGPCKGKAIDFFFFKFKNQIFIMQPKHNFPFNFLLLLLQ